jgi:hypothetical protein
VIGQSVRMSVPSLSPLIDALAQVGYGPELELRSAALAPQSLSLELHVALESGRLHSRWDLRCWHVVEYQIPFGIIESPQIEDDHPLLIEHTEPHAELFFSGPVSDPTQAVGTLAIAHHSIFRRWRPFGCYLNPHMPIDQLLTCPSATLAKGPLSALHAYSTALQSINIATSILNERPASHRRTGDDAGRHRTSREVLVLMFGEDPMSRSDEPFVIAQSFSATRLADN